MSIVEEKAINTLRILSMEQVANAKSGHSGMPLGIAPSVYTLFAKHLNFSAKNPYTMYADKYSEVKGQSWFNRDRFILSAGHASSLLYSALHCFGFPIKKSDLQAFRGLGSITQGHPEFKRTPGVECSTGPLGQGLANAVGVAYAQKMLAERFNRAGFEIVKNHTYCLVSDGDLMEGISYEACNLASLWNLNRLIVLYDSNNITIDGKRTDADSEDVVQRFKAIGWNVFEVNNGNSVSEIGSAIMKAKLSQRNPSIIVVKTIIGFGSSMAGTSKVHGIPLPDDEVVALRASYGFGKEPFSIDKDVASHFAQITKEKEKEAKQWEQLFAKYKKKYLKEAKDLEDFIAGKMPETKIQLKNPEKSATRDFGGDVLNQIGNQTWHVVTISADVASTTRVAIKGGKNIMMGIREHAMAAIANGLALGGFRVVCGCFCVFSDYMRGAMRMSAIMQLPVAYVLTHDSIGAGEDGETHQSIEQFNGLRMIPDFTVFRPAYEKETAAAYKMLIEGRKPGAIILTRQIVPAVKDQESEKGGYVISKENGNDLDAIIIATGSEVQHAIKAQEQLQQMNICTRVVSMPSTNVFDKQTEQYKQSVLPKEIRARVAIEAGNTDFWWKYVGLDGAVIGVDTFGESGKAEDLFNKYGITTDNVVKKVRGLVKV